MLKSIKQRLSGASDKTSSKSTNSNIVSSLKRAIQSTPDLLNMQDERYEHFSSTKLAKHTPPHFHTLEFPKFSSGKSSAMEPLVSSPATLLKGFPRERKTPPMPAEEVLFSPSNDAARAGAPGKMKIKFALKKKKLLAYSQAVSKPPTSHLPMITLTTPDDEQVYVLHRPTPPISSHTFLAVPSSSCPPKNISETPKVSAKKWPHPAGPWLRLTTSEENEFKTKSGHSTCQGGWRLGNGNVIGWDSDCMDALGISLPPQLPTEHDLKTIALIEQISKSLDQAQDALYCSFPEQWESGMDEDDCEVRIIEWTWLPPLALTIHMRDILQMPFDTAWNPGKALESKVKI